MPKPIVLRIFLSRVSKALHKAGSAVPFLDCRFACEWRFDQYGRYSMRFQKDSEVLESWKPNLEGLLFATRKGTPLGANNVVQRQLWPILDALKISRCGLHAFRHTHSSLLLDVGAPASVAQAQLGHSDARITLDVYSHVVFCGGPPVCLRRCSHLNLQP